jgi:hypothetical protein
MIKRRYTSLKRMVVHCHQLLHIFKQWLTDNGALYIQKKNFLTFQLTRHHH